MGNKRSFMCAVFARAGGAFEIRSLAVLGLLRTERIRTSLTLCGPDRCQVGWGYRKFLVVV